jgi:uncharacterized protein YjiS (DUF1127 family)
MQTQTRWIVPIVLWRRAIGQRLAEWRLRRRQRAELASMSDAELRDMQIGRYEAWLETHKPFWRA